MKYRVFLKDCTDKSLMPGVTTIVKGIILEAADVNVEQDTQGNPVFYNFLNRIPANAFEAVATVAVFPFNAVAYVLPENFKETKMNLLKGTWIILTMLAIALFVNHACAQTAKVVELTKEEQATATKLYEDKIEAEKAWDDFHQHISDKYLADKRNAPAFITHSDGMPFYTMKVGWDFGFDFSEGLRFIVPKAPPVFSTSSCLSPAYFSPGPTQ